MWKDLFLTEAQDLSEEDLLTDAPVTPVSDLSLRTDSVWAFCSDLVLLCFIVWVQLKLCDVTAAV